jgi:hypothetical protein
MYGRPLPQKIVILTSLLKNVNTPVYFRHAGQPGTATVSVLGPHAIY